MKRGAEDLDFFIGDEALTAASGPGTARLAGKVPCEESADAQLRLWYTLPCTAWTG